MTLNDGGLTNFGVAGSMVTKYRDGEGEQNGSPG
jgi:hypothetical protein